MTSLATLHPSRLTRTPTGAEQRAHWLLARPGHLTEETKGICVHCLMTTLPFWLYLGAKAGRA